jgi:hypothetical protein
MADELRLPLTFDPVVLAELACPACLNDLCLEDACLVCVTCDRAYPIVDGIPVLIVERAERAANNQT